MRPFEVGEPAIISHAFGLKAYDDRTGEKVTVLEAASPVRVGLHNEHGWRSIKIGYANGDTLWVWDASLAWEQDCI